MKDSTKKTIFGWLIAATCAVVLLSSTSTAITNVKDMFKDEESKVEQTESGNEDEASVYDYVI